MTSARERAVEAGARAIYSDTYAHDLAKEPAETIELYQGLARNCLRAAFPILAEELVAWHDEQAERCRGRPIPKLVAGPAHTALLQAINRHERYAVHLRARIQQMAEAL